MSILDSMRLLQVFGVNICNKNMVFAWRLITAISHNAFCAMVRGRFGPCAKALHSTGQRGPRRQIRTVMVSFLFAAARSEAVYDMHFVPLRAVFELWYLDGIVIRTLLWLVHGWSVNGMLSNMNAGIACARIFL